MRVVMKSNQTFEQCVPWRAKQLKVDIIKKTIKKNWKKLLELAADTD